MVCLMNAQNSDYIKIVEAAIKAPSGHNSQPWFFQLEDSAINISPNMEEILPIVDKSNRELFISLGAATENLCIEASVLGYDSNAYMNPCEIDELALEIQKNVGQIKGEYPTLLLRIGYAEPTPFSPRKKVNDVIIE